MTDQTERDRAALRGIREALFNLAAPADDQIRYLRGQGSRIADELALEFDDYFLVVDGLSKRGFVSTEQVEALRRLSRTLRDMSGQENKALWPEEALRECVQWEKVREQAEEALFHFSSLEPGS